MSNTSDPFADHPQNIAEQFGEEEEMKSTEGETAGNHSRGQHIPKHETNRGSGVNGEGLRPRILGKCDNGKMEVIGYMPDDVLTSIRSYGEEGDAVDKLIQHVDVCIEKAEVHEVFEITDKEINALADLGDWLIKELGETVTVDALLNFDREKDESSLIGKRWLCKGKMAVLQGPTGVGKSSLIMQWAIRLILALGFFGIRPARAMKVLIIQAENDLGDMAEALQDMLDAMKLGLADVDKLRSGLVIINEDSKTSVAFTKFLEDKINEHRPDIVFVDPLLAYIGGDILKQEVASKFLRNDINPILRRTNALLIWVHHTSKPGGNANGKEPSAEQNKYSGLGSSELQNTCREVMNLSDLGDGLFELSFMKRGGRLGLKGEDGKPIRKFNIEHGKDGIVWTLAAGDKANANKAKAKNIKAVERVQAHIIAQVTITIDQLKTWASQQEGIGMNAAVAAAKAMAHDETPRENRIYMYKLDPIIGTDGKKVKGEPPTVFSTKRPKWMEEKFEQECAIAREEFNENLKEGSAAQNAEL